MKDGEEMTSERSTNAVLSSLNARDVLMSRMFEWVMMNLKAASTGVYPAGCRDGQRNKTR